MTLLKTLLKFGEKYGPACDIQSRYELTYTAEDEDRMFADIVDKVRGNRKRLAAGESVLNVTVKCGYAVEFSIDCITRFPV